MPKCTCFKYLGLIIDKTGCYDKHVNYRISVTCFLMDIKFKSIVRQPYATKTQARNRCNGGTTSAHLRFNTEFERDLLTAVMKVFVWPWV